MTTNDRPVRLVVELNRQTTADLAYLVETEHLNKTTIVNRAVQVYRLVRDADELIIDGERVRIV